MNKDNVNAAKAEDEVNQNKVENTKATSFQRPMPPEIQAALQAMAKAQRCRPKHKVATGGFLMRAAKRAVRHMLAWLLVPICEEQNKFNAAALSFCQNLIVYLEERNAPELSADPEAGGVCFDLNNLRYAQSGEDIIISFVLSALGLPPDQATYLDLGANHAKFLNNTYLLYLHGARGVLVEANPHLIPELKLCRLGDTIVNCCVSDKSGELVDFYIYEQCDALSTVSKDRVQEVANINSAIVAKEIAQIPTININDLIKTYLGKAPTVVSIDLEGSDMLVLQSLDFDQYRPLAFIVEIIPPAINALPKGKDEAIVRFMESKGYYEYAFTGINSIFLDRRQVEKKAAS